MEWTRDKTLCLINEYRKRRGLWDMTHDDYRKKEVKQKLLYEVSNCLGDGISTMEIEKKFHTLRTQYHREINRMKRKEPYNSKWFGYKNLQFLSSPKACRSNKGRIKSEITEDGTVTTKYIIREAESQHENSDEGSPNSSNNINEEFLTIHRKPTITYKTLANGTTTVSATNRSHELEKLIEETTKDVEDIEEPKPKVTIKKITVPLDHHSFGTHTQLYASAETVISATDEDPLHTEEGHHHHQQIDVEEEPIGTIDIQTAEEELAYQSSSSTTGGTGVVTHTQNAVHHHSIPTTRIIKIQRRTTNPEDDYYNEEHHQHQHTQHHIHNVPANTTKRIFYDANGHQHTATILQSPAAPTDPVASSTNIKMQNRTVGGQSQQHPSSPQTVRDEFTTYGEYVANEMRGITNREILISLKHKINTSLFEANMAEIHK